MSAHRLFVIPLAKDDRGTPQQFFDALHKEFNFTIDVAALPHNAKLPSYFTPDDDGLKQEWTGTVWCNPPYSEIGDWVKKAVSEQRKGVLSVFLLPASTDVAWFHDWVLPHAEIRWVRGRLRFGGTDNTAPFGSMIAIFRPPTQ